MKTYTRVAAIVLLAVGWMASNVLAQQAGIDITFSNVTETIKVKEKVDKKTMTTTVTSNFTVSGDVVIDNTSTSNAPAFPLGLWTDQTSSNFDETAGPLPMFRKEKALKAGKSTHVGLKLRFLTDQAGTFFFLTGSADTNGVYPVITFVQIPPAE